MTPTAFERMLDALTSNGGRVSPRGDHAAAQCPAHEDRTASLSVTRSETGVLVKCHAGCGVDDVLQVLGLQRRDLFDTPREQRVGHVVVAEYPYTDEAGEVLYVKVRHWPKDFRQYRDTSKGRQWSLGDVRRVLYRLPEVCAAVASGQPVYLAEGEKDADALAAAGVAATTWADGAWKPDTKHPKWRPEYTAALKGAQVVIVADDDEAGRHTATGIAQALAQAAASVRVVLPAEGKDAHDHLTAGRSVEDFRPLELPTAAESAESAEQGKEGKGPSQATLLRRLALARYTFGVGLDGSPFALPRSGPRIARPFRGGRSALRAELAALYAEENGGTVPGASALSDALMALEGEALASEPRPLATRVATEDGISYLDLGRPDGRVVRIGPGGWRVVDEASVLFRRTQLTGALPDPAQGGSLQPLRDRLNVGAEDWPLVLSWLVAALIPDMPHPVLSLVGEQGTGKSTATELLVNVLDPSPAPLRSAPRDVEQWAVTAAASWVVGLDNVSGMASWFSDVLCRAVTGDGMVRRMLYSDGDVSVLAFRRVVVTNGIDYGAVRGDLADRMLSVELHRITASQRRTAAAVAMHDHDRARVLGALLDLACEVLAFLPDVDLAEMPRMADFSRVVAAVDKVTGTNALARYAAQAADLATAVVDADPFATALTKFIEGHPSGEWSGTGGELLDHLQAPDPKPRSWPADRQRANAAVRRTAPALRQAEGLEIEESKHPKTRQVVWTIRMASSEMQGAQPSQPSQPSNLTVTWDDAAKPDETAAFAPPSPGFAPPDSAKPGPKPDPTPGFAPHHAGDLHEYDAAKAAKAAKPGSPPFSYATCRCPNGHYDIHREGCPQLLPRAAGHP